MSHVVDWLMEKEAGPRLANLNVLKKLIAEGKTEDEIIGMIATKSNRLTNRLEDALTMRNDFAMGQPGPTNMLWFDKNLDMMARERNALNHILDNRFKDTPSIKKYIKKLDYIKDSMGIPNGDMGSKNYKLADSNIISSRYSV